MIPCDFDEDCRRQMDRHGAPLGITISRVIGSAKDVLTPGTIDAGDVQFVNDVQSTAWFTLRSVSSLLLSVPSLSSSLLIFRIEELTSSIYYGRIRVASSTWFSPLRRARGVCEDIQFSFCWPRFAAISLFIVFSGTARPVSIWRWLRCQRAGWSRRDILSSGTARSIGL